MYSQLSDFQKFSIRSDYWSGMSVTNICKKYGISKTTAGLMFYSDNGGQYTSRAFRSLLVNCAVDQSFSRPHTPIDNAVAESFFCQFKKRGNLQARLSI